MTGGTRKDGGEGFGGREGQEGLSGGFYFPVESKLRPGAMSDL